MEARELMCGDWVQDTYPNGKKFYTKVNIPIFCNYLSGDEVHPIPLTPKILEKNGWKYNKYWQLWMHEDIPHWIIALNESFQWVRKDECYGDEYHIANCNKVHLFQHALRLCGLTELADGFKV